MQVDIFSFGMFMYEMISLHFPFEKQNLMSSQIEKLVIEGERPPLQNRGSGSSGGGKWEGEVEGGGEWEGEVEGGRDGGRRQWEGEMEGDGRERWREGGRECGRGIHVRR